MDNNNNNKTIRIISRNGKYRFAYVILDHENEIERILEESLDMGYRNETEFQRLKDMLREAAKLPIVHVSNDSAKFYGLI